MLKLRKNELRPGDQGSLDIVVLGCAPPVCIPMAPRASLSIIRVKGGGTKAQNKTMRFCIVPVWKERFLLLSTPPHPQLPPLSGLLGTYLSDKTLALGEAGLGWVETSLSMWKGFIPSPSLHVVREEVRALTAVAVGFK